MRAWHFQSALYGSGVESAARDGRREPFSLHVATSLITGKADMLLMLLRRVIMGRFRTV